MKGSDKILMTINIGGENIRLNVGFDEQNDVRDAERDVKLYIESLKKKWPESSDRKVLAMAAYRFANRYNQLNKTYEEGIEYLNTLNSKIDNWETPEQGDPI